VDQDRINRFADATGDHQWIHVDPARAKKESPFGDAVAHGFLTLSLIPCLTKAVPVRPRPIPGEDGGQLWAESGPVHGSGEGQLPRPSAEHAQGSARGRGGLQMVSEVTIEVEGQEKPSCVAETVSRLYF